MARTKADWLGIKDQANQYFPHNGSDVDEYDKPNLASASLQRISRTLSNRVSCGGQMVTEIKGFFLDTKLNLLLVFLPIAFASRYAGWGDGPTFVLSCLALTPLAERLGFVTEQLANYTNDTLGGLLNATFGNATEVIISAFALAKGGTTYLRVVQLSLLGSITSNLLLVMGSAFIAGGLKTKVQKFNQQGINVNAGLLILSTLAIILPSLLSETHTAIKDKHSELALSRFESIIMLLCYGLYLFFQLYTHRHLYEEDVGHDEVAAAPGPSTQAGPRELEMSSAALHHTNGDLETQRLVDRDGQATPRATEAEEDAEEDEQILSKVGCFIWLTIVTVFIAVLSEFITGAIIGASKSLGIPMPFLVTILLPIVGNAAEHASAVTFAYKDKIEIALGVAVGSSTQVGVLVVPFCVILAWMMGKPLDLNFNAFETTVLFATVLLAIIVLQDGTANWLKGCLLVITYFFTAAGFWCHKDVELKFEYDGR